MKAGARGETHGRHGKEGVVIEVRDLTNRFDRQVVHHKLNLDVMRRDPWRHRRLRVREIGAAALHRRIANPRLRQRARAQTGFREPGA